MARRAAPRCRCGSGRKLARCCGPLLDGRAAPSPEALMRSRYTAYARGDVDYILSTTAPDGPIARPDRAAWRAELLDYVAEVSFVGLRVLQAPPPAGEVGEVHFRATLRRGVDELVQEERSRFVLRDGRWLYWGEL